MLRDKHKDRAYFEKWITFVQKRLEKNINMTDDISEEYLLFHYQDLVLNNEELVKLSYSIGASNFSLLSRDSVLSQTHCLRGSSI